MVDEIIKTPKRTIYQQFHPQSTNVDDPTKEHPVEIPQVHPVNILPGMPYPSMPIMRPKYAHDGAQPALQPTIQSGGGFLGGNTIFGGHPSFPNPPAPKASPSSMQQQSGGMAPQQHYMGSPEYYGKQRDALVEKIKGIDTKDPVAMLGAQKIIQQDMERAAQNIVLNPNKDFKNKRYYREMVDFWKNDPQLRDFKPIIEEAANRHDDEARKFGEAYNNVQELEKRGATQNLFSDAMQKTIDKAIATQDRNILKDPKKDDFPDLAEFFKHAELNSHIYEDALYKRGTGLYDVLLRDKKQSLYSDLLRYGHKRQESRIGGEGVPGYAGLSKRAGLLEWIDRNYPLDAEDLTSIDADIRGMLDSVFRQSLDAKSGTILSDSEQQDLVKAYQESQGALLPAPVHRLADGLANHAQSYPETLNDQPSDVDIEGFVKNNMDLNRYLVELVRTGRANEWESAMEKELPPALLPHFNQNLVYKAVPKLISITKQAVNDAGGLEKFLAQNTEPGIAPVSHDSRPLTERTKELEQKAEYLRKKEAELKANTDVAKNVKKVPDEGKREIVEEATKKMPQESNPAALAEYVGSDEPLDGYRDSLFEEWQDRFPENSR